MATKDTPPTTTAIVLTMIQTRLHQIMQFEPATAMNRVVDLAVLVRELLDAEREAR